MTICLVYQNTDFSHLLARLALHWIGIGHWISIIHYIDKMRKSHFRCMPVRFHAATALSLRFHWRHWYHHWLVWDWIRLIIRPRHEYITLTPRLILDRYHWYLSSRHRADYAIEDGLILLIDIDDDYAIEYCHYIAIATLRDINEYRLIRYEYAISDWPLHFSRLLWAASWALR